MSEPVPAPDVTPAPPAIVGQGSVTPWDNVRWLAGPVLNVHDGDTFRIGSASEQSSIRLLGVDAPELGTEWGAAAARRAQEILAEGRTVEIGIEGEEVHDIYGKRFLAWVNVADPAGDAPDGGLLQSRLAGEGLVVPYVPAWSKAHAYVVEIFEAAANARAAERGVWRYDGPGEALFRHRHPQWTSFAEALAAKAPEAAGQAVLPLTSAPVVETPLRLPPSGVRAPGVRSL